MRRRILFLLLAAILACDFSSYAQNHEVKKTDGQKSVKNVPTAKETVYNFSLVDLDGKVIPLSTYKGKVLLIVNLASKSYYHDQISSLSDLAKNYSEQGLVVLGIPSAEFGGEELKDAAELHKYYTDAKLNLSVFTSAKLTGPQIIPLYRFLTDPKTGLPGGDVHWNYTKFLIDREGNPLTRYEVGTDPADIDFHVQIEKALSGKLKKQSDSKRAPDVGGEEDDGP